MTTTYNGWTNRETWVWNLHYGDALAAHLTELAEDGYFNDAGSVEDIRCYIEALSERLLDEVLEAKLVNDRDGFIADLLNEHLIDHEEIAAHHFNGVMAALVEGLKDLDPEHEPCWVDDWRQQQQGTH